MLLNSSFTHLSQLLQHLVPGPVTHRVHWVGRAAGVAGNKQDTLGAFGLLAGQT